jgi:nucleotide-binding universal stress UspA family protein
MLVPLEDTPESWLALEQAIVLAQQEGAQLHGLHIVASVSQAASRAVEILRSRFNERCAAAGVAGHLVTEAGTVTKKICERALLTDLVVMSSARPPQPGLASLGSGLRAILWKCARPVLTVAGPVSHFQHALLLYDGSPKAREALFVAAYLAERRLTALRVLALLDGARVSESVLDYPRAYLEMHEINADYRVVNGNEDTFQAQIDARQTDLVLMGGYSVPPMAEVLGGSAVNYLLRQSPCPLLLCR